MKLSCFTISVYISENLKYTQPKMNLKVWYTFNDDVQLLQILKISFNFLTQNDAYTRPLNCVGSTIWDDLTTMDWKKLDISTYFYNSILFRA